MLYFVALIIAVFDQIIKRLVVNNFYFGESLPIINDILHITYVKNTGAAFGILKNQTQLFVILSIIIIAVFLYLRKKYIKGNLLVDVTIGLIIGGAIGNLVDRVWLGYVVDYLDLRVWPVFNLADSAVVVGAFLLAFYLWNNELEV